MNQSTWTDCKDRIEPVLDFLEFAMFCLRYVTLIKTNLVSIYVSINSCFVE